MLVVFTAGGAPWYAGLDSHRLVEAEPNPSLGVLARGGLLFCFFKTCVKYFFADAQRNHVDEYGCILMHTDA